MSLLQIEKGVPIPPKCGGVRNQTALDMQAGDSVLCSERGQMKSLTRALSRLGKRAAVRKVPKQGWRVWVLP